MRRSAFGLTIAVAHADTPVAEAMAIPDRKPSIERDEGEETRWRASAGLSPKSLLRRRCVARCTLQRAIMLAQLSQMREPREGVRPAMQCVFTRKSENGVNLSQWVNSADCFR